MLLSGHAGKDRGLKRQENAIEKRYNFHNYESVDCIVDYIIESRDFRKWMNIYVSRFTENRLLR